MSALLNTRPDDLFTVCVNQSPARSRSLTAVAKEVEETRKWRDARPRRGGLRPPGRCRSRIRNALSVAWWRIHTLGWARHTTADRG
jgi:hypothetical protein